MKIAFLGVAVLILYKVAGFAFDYGYRIFAEEAVDREPGIDVNVAVVEGKSVKEIGKLLEEKGLIRDGTLFILQEKFSEYSGDLKPGVYTLNTSQTPYEMMAIMSQEAEETTAESPDAYDATEPADEDDSEESEEGDGGEYEEGDPTAGAGEQD